MYLLLISISINFLPFSRISLPVSIFPVASDPLLGPVRPKQGIKSPLESFGK